MHHLQTNLVLTTPETSLQEVTKLLEGPPSIEGLPVCDADKKVGRKLGGSGGCAGGRLDRPLKQTGMQAP